MLKDAPIVILDEATASIDPENEAVIQQAISRLTKGKTLIVIAHRLGTVAGADNIVVVEGGRIAAQSVFVDRGAELAQGYGIFRPAGHGTGLAAHAAAQVHHHGVTRALRRIRLSRICKQTGRAHAAKGKEGSSAHQALH